MDTPAALMFEDLLDCQNIFLTLRATRLAASFILLQGSPGPSINFTMPLPTPLPILSCAAPAGKYTYSYPSRFRSAVPATRTSPIFLTFVNARTKRRNPLKSKTPHHPSTSNSVDEGCAHAKQKRAKVIHTRDSTFVLPGDGFGPN